MKLENQQEPCIVCKELSFIRTDGGKALCTRHFTLYASVEKHYGRGWHRESAIGRGDVRTTGSWHVIGLLVGTKLKQ